LIDPVNYGFDARICDITIAHAELWLKFCRQGWSGVNFSDTVKLPDHLKNPLFDVR